MPTGPSLDRSKGLNSESEKAYLKDKDMNTLKKELKWDLKVLEWLVIRNYHEENKNKISQEYINKIKDTVGDATYKKGLETLNKRIGTEGIAALQILAIDCVQKIKDYDIENHLKISLIGENKKIEAVDGILGPNTLSALQDIAKADLGKGILAPIDKWNGIINNTLIEKMMAACSRTQPEKSEETKKLEAELAIIEKKLDENTAEQEAREKEKQIQLEAEKKATEAAAKAEEEKKIAEAIPVEKEYLSNADYSEVDSSLFIDPEKRKYIPTPITIPEKKKDTEQISSIPRIDAKVSPIIEDTKVPNWPVVKVETTSKSADTEKKIQEEKIRQEEKKQLQKNIEDDNNKAVEEIKKNEAEKKAAEEAILAKQAAEIKLEADKQVAKQAAEKEIERLETERKIAEEKVRHEAEAEAKVKVEQKAKTEAEKQKKQEEEIRKANIEAGLKKQTAEQKANEEALQRLEEEKEAQKNKQEMDKTNPTVVAKAAAEAEQKIKEDALKAAAAKRKAQEEKAKQEAELAIIEAEKIKQTEIDKKQEERQKLAKEMEETEKRILAEQKAKQEEENLAKAEKEKNENPTEVTDQRNPKYPTLKDYIIDYIIQKHHVDVPGATEEDKIKNMKIERQQAEEKIPAYTQEALLANPSILHYGMTIIAKDYKSWSEYTGTLVEEPSIKFTKKYVESTKDSLVLKVNTLKNEKIIPGTLPLKNIVEVKLTETKVLDKVLNPDQQKVFEQLEAKRKKEESKIRNKEDKKEKSEE